MLSSSTTSWPAATSVKDVFDTGHFERQWKSLFAAGDPYFSPLLSRHADDYRPDDEPVEGIFAGPPAVSS